VRRLRLAGLLFTPALLVLPAAQAGAAKSQARKVKQTAKPISALAMDGARVAYMRSDRRVEVWNVGTGATSVVKGAYPSAGSRFGTGDGEVAIAGKRVAVITRFVIGNSQQTQERLYTAALGGSAHRLGKLTNHETDPPDCEGGDPGLATGNWIAGLVGSGKILAVSTWKASDSVPTHERLNLVTPTGLRTIVTGRGAIVATSASDGRIAVLRSTGAWPPLGDVGPATPAPTVGVYSAAGSLLGKVPLSIPPLDACGYSHTTIRVALDGDQLVVLKQTILQPGSLQSTVEVYDWKTGTLEHTWPISVGHSPGGSVAAYGQIAAVQSVSKLLLLNLSTGKTDAIAPTSLAAIGPRGLVYAVNSAGRHPHGELVFVQTSKLPGLGG
jgi:hypothetical protein